MALEITDQKLNEKDLLSTHSLYDENIANWQLLMASYEGTRKLVELGYLKRNERESLENYQRRTSEAFGFNYTRSIIDLFNFYLFKKPVKRDVGKLKDDELWNAFVDDCDFNGTALDDFFTEQNKYSATYGAVGILVDRAHFEFDTKEEQKQAGVYPYLSAYSPPAILDWDFDKDKFNRPYLSYLKLLDDNGEYLLWWPDRFEVYILLDREVKLKRKGINPLGLIPFIWLYNIKGRKRPIGVSDVEEIVRIDRSIMRNLSDGEEIITYAAFPMMRKPRREGRPDGAQSYQGADDVGATAILEFDPEHPESKPDWLPVEVSAPIDAIIRWVENKVAEIYRATNVGGMSSMEISSVAKSGVALQAEFQLLNATLIKKARNLEQAEKQILYFWLLWEGQQELYDDIIIERAKTYDVENLAADLENTLSATLIVTSKKFKNAVQKQIARQMLPSYNDEQMAEIDQEIDSYIEPVVKHPVFSEEE